MRSWRAILVKTETFSGATAATSWREYLKNAIATPMATIVKASAETTIGSSR